MAYELGVQVSDARLLYLALSYHLARPGSEVDPETLATTKHGLREVAENLRPHLNEAATTVTLSPFQLSRIGQAMLGTVNELKAYPMLKAQASGRNAPVSAVAGFDDMLATLFPEIEEDENVALDLAQDMMMLRRRLDTAIAESDAAEAQEEPAGADAKPAPRWQFWRR